MSFLKENGMNLEKCRSIPFWSWNDKLDEKKLLRQIDWMAKNAMGGFFMHARPGLQTEYLSDEWMRCIAACAKRARLRGLDAWVYDENGWPSGFAGGKLLENPENHDKYLQHTIGIYDPNATVSYLVTAEELIRSNGEEPGEYLNIYERLSSSTADILNPQVVEQFIQHTHEQYKKYFGDEFSDCIKGFFTDEPQYYRWDVPYTDMIRRYFSEQFHEDILDGIGLLFLKKKGWRRFRYLYWRGMQTLMLSSFAEKIYDWCEQNGVMLTGHYVEENTLGFQMTACGGVMPFYEFEHIPGMDWLGRYCDSAVAAKQVTSVAAQLDKPQVLAEIYAGCGWDVTPHELKNMTEYLYMNGINITCQHLLPYSERGCRIHDYPAHFSEINPWVRECFGEFNEYFSQLGSLLAEWPEQVRVAVLHPIRSAYFDYDRTLENEGFGIQKLDDSFAELTGRLEKSGINYHFLDETLLAKYGSVEGTGIRCGCCVYDVLILPYCLTMDKSTEKLLRRYVKGGGRVFLFSGRPQYLEWEEHDYAYLSSCFTWQELEDLCAPPISYSGGQLCISRRHKDGKELFMLLNHAYDEECKVHVTLSAGYHSLRRIILPGRKETHITPDFILQPGESALLIPSEEICDEEIIYETVYPKGEYRVLSCEDNSFVIDTVCYSKNGTDYSEKIALPLLFRQLLQERYHGKLYLKYCFEIRDLPSRLCFNMHIGKGIMSLNGVPVTPHTHLEPLIKIGENEFVLECDYYQSEHVYHVLFGENITEALKNCLTFDCEMEPLILTGNFGVYEQKAFQKGVGERIWLGESFIIGNSPYKIKNLVQDGYPFFAGKIRLSTELFCTKAKVMLDLPGRWHVARVTVNGIKCGEMLFDRTLDISDAVRQGKNDLELELVIGNRNLYGPHHFAPEEEPFMQSPDLFEFRELDWSLVNQTYRSSMTFVEVLD